MKGYHLIGLDLYREDETVDECGQWLDKETDDFLDRLGHYLRLRSEFEQYLADRGDVE